jgi:hypothetical protein
MKRKLCIAGTFLAALLAMPPSVPAEMLPIVTATFADGKGWYRRTTSGTVTQNNVNTVVDAFRGKAGGGWAAGWGLGPNTSSTEMTWQVLGEGDTGEHSISYNKLVDDNYLSYRMYYSGTSSRHDGLWRDYDGEGGIDPSAPHAIQFTVRIDENIAGNNFSDATDRYEIHDRKTFQTSATGSTDQYYWNTSYSTWGIGLRGTLYDKAWWVASGTSQIDTGVTVTQGTPYTFTLVFDPENGTSNGTYDVTIASGEDTLYEGSNFQMRHITQGIVAFRS